MSLIERGHTSRLLLILSLYVTRHRNGDTFETRICPRL